MPNNGSPLARLRDSALFAFFMLTGARDGAVASLRLKHVNLQDRHVFQDGREVATKNAKTFDTWFFPVDAAYLDIFSRWVTHLQKVLIFGNEDPLFPKQMVRNIGGEFVANGFLRDPYSWSSKLNAIIEHSFESVQMPQHTQHSFRKTWSKYYDEVCKSMEELKAWSIDNSLLSLFNFSVCRTHGARGGKRLIRRQARQQ